MVSRTSLLPLVMICAACGASREPAAPAEPTVAAPVVSAEPTALPQHSAAVSAAPSAEAAPPAPAANKPVSAYKISGKSLTEVDVAMVKAALEKAGYGVGGLEEIVTCGETETLQLTVTRKGKPVGLFSLQRPAAKPDDCKLASVKESYEKWKPSAEGPKSKNALTFDEAASVLLALNLHKDEPGAAKKLMEALVTK